MNIEVEIINKSNNPLPKYETVGSAGLDIKANLEEDIILKPQETRIVPTGLFVAIPVGYMFDVRPRSGLAAKFDITVLNSPGTVDSDYRGEIKVILNNAGTSSVQIGKNDRVAQLVLQQVPRCIFKTVDTLSTTDRGEGGFGSTGSK